MTLVTASSGYALKRKSTARMTAFSRAEPRSGMEVEARYGEQQSLHRSEVWRTIATFCASR